MTPEDIEKNKQENERIFKLPKRFLEDARILIREGNIVFAFYTGDGTETFVLTPHSAKRISGLLAHQITNYESTFAVIPASWTPASMQSPIQPADLQNPPQDSGAGNPPPPEPKDPNKPKEKK
jgi:uncharacterized protein YaiL (DUF2058 family)